MYLYIYVYYIYTFQLFIHYIYLPTIILYYRPARTDVPSMYIEEDGFNDEEIVRPAEIRSHNRITSPNNTRYVSEGFVQYSQPSLNGIPLSIYLKL